MASGGSELEVVDEHNEILGFIYADLLIDEENLAGGSLYRFVLTSTDDDDEPGIILLRRRGTIHDWPFSRELA